MLYSAALGFFSVGLLESIDTTLADKRAPLDSDIIDEYIRQGEKAKEGSLEYVLGKELRDTLAKNPEATWTAFEIGRIVKNYKQNGYTPSNADAVIDEKAVLDAVAQNKNTPTENVEGEKVKSVTGGNANQYSLNIVHSNDQIETLNDARSLTKEQAVEYLNQAKSGGIKGHSYVPVRSDTPQVIIDTVAQVGENIGNHSLVMQVRKAQQAMSTENPGAKNKAHGNNVRKHALTPEKIVDIVNNIDNTNLIVYQTNRQDKNGNALPNNVAVFVEYNDDGNEGVAVIEFDGLTSASEFVGSEAGDTNYHTVVTVFEPDTQRNGMSFDYAEEILSNPDNIELQIVRRPNERSATREKHPNTSNELPSDNTIPQTSPQVNTENYPTVSRDGIEIKPESDPEIQKRLSEAKDDIERTGILSGASEHTIALARRLEKLLGVKIRFEVKPIGTHKNGRYNRVEDTIYVNMSEDNDAVTQIIVHEFIHSIEGTRLHASLFRFAEKMTDRKHGKGTFNNRAHETIKDYEKGGEALTLPQAQNEVVCNFIADNLLKDEETIKHFVREHRTLAERFQRLIDRVLSVFSNKATRTEAKTRLALEKANRLYKDAMQTRKTGADLKTRVDELRQKYQNGEITEEEFDSSIDELSDEAAGIGLSIDDFFKGGGDSFSISKKLESDLDAVLNGTFDSSKNEVYIGETSNFMVETIGANSLSVYMPASKAYSAMVTEEEYNKNPYYSKQDHYHGIGKEDLVEILEKSEMPIVAFADAHDQKGNPRDNRIVLVTDKKIKDLSTGTQEYAVVVEEVDSNARVDGKRIKANKTITIYPRAKLYEDIQTAVADGRLLDMTTKGEHLFAGGRGANSQAAIQRDVLKKNIANFWANVKWKGEKTSSSSPNITLTPMQIAFQKAGLLDQDGQLQYMQDSKNDTDNTDSYSISTPVFTPDKVAKEVVEKAESNIDIAERLPKKAHMRLREVEKKLCKDIAKVYGIRYDRIPELQEGVRVLVNEYLTDGSIAESTLRGYFADFMKGNIIDNKRRVIYNIFTTKEVIIYDKIGCF